MSDYCLVLCPGKDRNESTFFLEEYLLKDFQELPKIIFQGVRAPLHKAHEEIGHRKENKTHESDPQRLRVLSLLDNIKINVLNVSEETNGRIEIMTQEQRIVQNN